MGSGLLREALNEPCVCLYSLDNEDADQAAVEQREHADWVTAVQFSPDGKYLLSGDRGGCLLYTSDAADE